MSTACYYYCRLVVVDYSAVLTLVNEKLTRTRRQQLEHEREQHEDKDEQEHTEEDERGDTTDR